ncbi:sensor histidine kinase [Pedobacter sp. MR22-3]|uniref:sensor histidine kinase n=1 Tax=Pedobacter sp. MR22-3 TaxID=2994552 RepID=UPI002245556C|nr:sensor histidine kinase [Pedobacter sp. MR22-3]MCX2584341.1 histidine kinase [Pedobacter sp. MR22-3]
MTKKIFEWTKTQKIHLIGWSVFIFLEITLIGLAAGAFGKPLNYLLHYILNIILFYSNAHLVLKISFRTKQHAISRLIILMVLQIGCYILFRALLNYYLSDTTKSFNFPTIVEHYRSFFQSLWRGLFFIGLSCFYYLFIEYKSERTLREEAENAKYIKRLRIREMENELSIAQYDYLRAQINPHLLFNTLSFLYDSIRKYNEDAGQAVLNLADLMRFSLETRESNEELPRLDEEIKQIYNLIELNKIRKDKEQFIDVFIPKGAKQFRFIPLVIITLLENMLKHGNLSRQEHPGLLEIKLNHGEFSIHTRNLISTKIHSSGFNKGMENIEKRLGLAYGTKFSLSYGKRNEIYFDVNINLRLDIAE